MLEVDSLAPPHEGFRGRPVEPEMPETRVVVDGFPLTYPRQEGVHQDHLLHLGGELTGVGVGDHQAYVVPDHAGSLDAEQPGERVNARGRRFDVQTGRRDLRFADATAVW